MRLIGYVRTSTSHPSADHQKRDLLNAGVATSDVYADHDAGRASPSWPHLDRALDSLRPGDTLTIDTLARLGPTARTVLSVAHKLQTRGAALRVLNLGVDTSTGVGSMLFITFAALTQMEHEL